MYKLDRAGLNNGLRFLSFLETISIGFVIIICVLKISSKIFPKVILLVQLRLDTPLSLCYNLPTKREHTFIFLDGGRVWQNKKSTFVLT